MPHSAYDRFLATRRDTHCLRQLRAMGPSSSGRTRMGARQLLNFSSNNYMGLADHPTLIARARAWSALWGTGATASRLVCGNMELFDQVEHKLAQGKGYESALVFNSGFQANSSLLAALLDPSILKHPPLVFSDRLNHASMHHGIRAAGVRQIRYRHNDLNHLEHLLEQHRSAPNPKFILSETVFSMDGDRADVAGLIELKQRHHAFLYLDEAHAVGILGKDGFGLAADFPGAADLVMGTFSKALGGFGAYAVCTRRLRDFLINHCSGFIYATALPPAVLGAMDAALELLPTLQPQRQRLLQHSHDLRQRLQSIGLDTGTSTTQIIPVILGAEHRTLSMSNHLETEAAIMAIAVRPPTVPAGSSRIRFSLTAAHDGPDIERLFEAVQLWPG
ncbi:MAG: 8-amino-7-oxononanoate synthase [Magnetococcales bacterium]|nr:8-amino-7-oxononanoate synthase [Magnetococcales bacterium]MBF0151654.1 8-amino-7-oxononanoate synthase [Magnetococcales bacterium]MBF0174461.1 8-amino-7-oxononanoate synthase [Magnetococcales bacterium]MBF0631504.1 8-amino-7-oxononanoate synthase [Magnetococcales bacterium]